MYALAVWDPQPFRDAAVAARGLVSHTSAAALWQLEGLVPYPAAHVTVRRKARPAVQRDVVLHFADVPPHEERGGATSPVRTVLDCARILPFAEGLAIADSALRRGLVEQQELLGRAVQCRANGRAAALRVVTHAHGLSANPFESGLRAAVIERGIRGFVPQLPVRFDDFAARVDLGDADRRIALEADSFAFHGARSALERDCRRYNELVQRDWLVLRFSWGQVMFERDWVSDVIARTCRLQRRGTTRQ